MKIQIGVSLLCTCACSLSLAAVHRYLPREKDNSNRVRLLTCLEEGKKDFWNRRTFTKHLADLRNQTFKTWQKLPGTEELFTNLQSDLDLYRLVDAALPRGPEYNVGKFKFDPNRHDVLTRKDVLERITRLHDSIFYTHKTELVSDWKRSFPPATQLIESLWSSTSPEMSDPYKQIQELAKYLDLYNVQGDIVEHYEKGKDKKRGEDDKIDGYKLRIRVPSVPFPQHWATLLAAKLAQQPVPVSLSFATYHKTFGDLAGGLRSDFEQMEMELPLHEAIDPHAPSQGVEYVLYENDQLQRRKLNQSSWPNHILIVADGSRLQAESIGAGFKRAVFSLALFNLDGGEGIPMNGMFPDSIRTAADWARRAREMYEHALDLLEKGELQFEHVRTTEQYDIFDWYLSSSQAIRMYSPKISVPTGKQAKGLRARQVAKELVSGYAWVADYGDLLRADSADGWIEDGLACFQLFDFEKD